MGNSKNDDDVAEGRLWGARLKSNFCVPPQQTPEGYVFYEALIEAFAQVERWDLMVGDCVIKREGGTLTITTYERSDAIPPTSYCLTGTVCSECHSACFESHPLNGCPLQYVREVMKS